MYVCHKESCSNWYCSKNKNVFVSISFFEKATYCGRSTGSLSFVEIIYFRSKSKSNRLIALKLGLNVGNRAMHVSKEFVYEIQVATYILFENKFVFTISVILKLVYLKVIN